MTRNAKGWLSAVLPALIPRSSVISVPSPGLSAWKPVDGGADEACGFRDSRFDYR
jgi:hypothetical protein